MIASSPPARPPTAHQREVAELLIEECAEVIQRATKLLRFGVEEVQPGQPLDNADRLSLEIGDALEVIDRAVRAGIARPPAIGQGRENKRRQLARYMQTTPPPEPGDPGWRLGTPEMARGN